VRHDRVPSLRPRPHPSRHRLHASCRVRAAGRHHTAGAPDP
jgi:hypothetical protein